MKDTFSSDEIADLIKKNYPFLTVTDVGTKVVACKAFEDLFYIDIMSDCLKVVGVNGNAPLIDKFTTAEDAVESIYDAYFGG